MSVGRPESCTNTQSTTPEGEAKSIIVHLLVKIKEVLKMSDLERIERYIKKTKVDERGLYDMLMSDMEAIYQSMQVDVVHAIGLAFDFGKAKGARAARAEARR